MKNSLRLTCVFDTDVNQQFEIEHTVFPGGEINLKLPEKFMEVFPEVDHLYVDCRIANSEGLMALTILRDALKRESHTASINLNLGYIPYARQDRVCNRGEAFGASVFATIIDTLQFDQICILDPHSKVSSSLICTDLTINTQQDMLVRIPWLLDYYPKHGGTKEITLVAPDIGASGKILKIADALEIDDIIQGLKIRDPETGKLSGFSYEGDVEGKHLLIVDDICDGGGTFIGLIKELWKGKPAKIDLYVSHGIFSRGVQCLFDSGITNIYTTDSCLHGYEHENLHIIKWY